jgi:uncharacterized protein YlxW (UPF0749 family)
MADTELDPATRVRTPLLELISEESLERDYQIVAQRRAAAGAGDGDSPRHPASRIGVIAVVAAFGALVTLAAVQTSRNADVEDASRATLIERIENRRAAVADLQGQVADLQDQNAEAEQDLIALVDDHNAVDARLRELETVTGFGAVTGEGLRIDLDNAPLADPETEYIRDSDLALLVNGLWEAGAEGIAINGQRLTAHTAIRNSGTAIEVNSTGIAPPYVVLATGNSDTLAANLAETPSGSAFITLASQYGFSYDSESLDEVRLPAAPPRVRELRSARELTPGGRQPEGGTS